MKPEFVDEVPNVKHKIREAPEPEWARELIARPGEWAIVERFGWDKSKANAMQSRIASHYWNWQDNHPGYWEAKYREYDNGYEVYARYVK